MGSFSLSNSSVHPDVTLVGYSHRFRPSNFLYKYCAAIHSSNMKNGWNGWGRHVCAPPCARAAPGWQPRHCGTYGAIRPRLWRLRLRLHIVAFNGSRCSMLTSQYLHMHYSRFTNVPSSGQQCPGHVVANILSEPPLLMQCMSLYGVRLSSADRAERQPEWSLPSAPCGPRGAGGGADMPSRRRSRSRSRHRQSTPVPQLPAGFAGNFIFQQFTAGSRLR
jgi:hypothetical protein